MSIPTPMAADAEESSLSGTLSATRCVRLLPSTGPSLGLLLATAATGQSTGALPEAGATGPSIDALLAATAAGPCLDTTLPAATAIVLDPSSDGPYTARTEAAATGLVKSLISRCVEKHNEAEVAEWQRTMSEATMLMQTWAEMRVQEEIAKLDVEEEALDAKLEAAAESRRKALEEKERVEQAEKAAREVSQLPVVLAATGEELMHVSVRLARTTVAELQLAIMREAALPLQPLLTCNGCKLEPSATLRDAGISRESPVQVEVYTALATSSEDKTTRIWNVDKGGKCEFILRGHKGPVNSACFAPDNATVVTCSQDHTVKIWSLVTGQCLHTLQGHTDSVCAAVFSPDRGSLLTYSDDCTAKLWSLRTLSCLFTLSAHTGPVYMARFADDGSTITTASRDGKMFLWDTVTGGYLRTMQGSLTPVELYSYSPGCRLTVTASPKLTTTVWDVATGLAELEICDHEKQVTHAAFARTSPAMLAAARAAAEASGRPLDARLQML